MTNTDTAITANAQIDAVSQKLPWLLLVTGMGAWLAALTTAGKILALAKESLVADLFGRSDGVEAYLLCFSLSNFFTMVLVSSLGPAVVPELVIVRTQSGREADQELFSALNTAVLIAMTLLAAAVFCLAPEILRLTASGFSGPKYAMALSFLRLIAFPFVIGTGMVVYWGSVANSYGRYASPVISAAVVPVVLIVFAACFARYIGVYALVTGTIVAPAAQLLVLGGILKRCGLNLRPGFRLPRQSARRLLARYSHLFLAGLVLALTNPIGKGIAGALSAGSVAALVYANRVPSLILTALVNGFCAPALTALSHVGRSAPEKCRKILISYLAPALVFASIASAILWVFSGQIVALLFQRGQFRPQDTEAVATVQRALAIQFPFYIGAEILMQYLSVQNLSQANVLGSAGALAAFAISAKMLVPRHGVSGIAYSTGVAYVALFCIWLAIASRHVKRSALLAGA